jgi:hypothetical protein
MICLKTPHQHRIGRKTDGKRGGVITQYILCLLLYYIILYYTILYYIILYRIISYHIILYTKESELPPGKGCPGTPATSVGIIKSYSTILRYIMLYYLKQIRITCNRESATSRKRSSRNASHPSMYYIMLCYVMLYHTICNRESATSRNCCLDTPATPVNIILYHIISYYMQTRERHLQEEVVPVHQPPHQHRQAQAPRRAPPVVSAPRWDGG